MVRRSCLILPWSAVRGMPGCMPRNSSNTNRTYGRGILLWGENFIMGKDHDCGWGTLSWLMSDGYCYDEWGISLWVLLWWVMDAVIRAVVMLPSYTCDTYDSDHCHCAGLTAISWNSSLTQRIHHEDICVDKLWLLLSTIPPQFHHSAISHWTNAMWPTWEHVAKNTMILFLRWDLMKLNSTSNLSGSRT